MAGGTGFEPVLAESESAVLPLDDPPLLHGVVCWTNNIRPHNSNQRFEYCGRFLAFLSPTFFRSTSRESRVTKPAFLRDSRSVSSYFIRARVIPCRSAPACPLFPPPTTFTRMSNLFSNAVTSSGCLTTIRAVSRPKYLSRGLLLTVISPVPDVRMTRAVDDFRLPVP